MSHLDVVTLSPSSQDQLIWLGDKNWIFSVKKVYDSAVVLDNPPSFPSSKVWSKAWPHKVGFFLWQACLGRIATMDNLHKRNMALSSSSLCPMCNGLDESVDHLLVQCSIVSNIWSYFFHSAGRSIVTGRSVREVLVSWKGLDISEQGKQLWRRLPAAIMWVFWLSRNAKVFSGKEIKVPDIIRDIKIQVFNWTKSHSCFSGVNISSIIVGWDQFFIRPP
ncbi:hypothetical protein MKW94_002162 [Papaver nudicaule]|uniref:Reverse transcriptase zinc-binding domain-containing protein n=1 Tax=Papaver nudicaule TaxID=74823 RepID=A0AA41VX79_PAPNU|nr:hypothetical protein [Papaver nudicaule]